MTHAHESHAAAANAVTHEIDTLRRAVDRLGNHAQSRWRLAVGEAEHDPTALELEDLAARLRRVRLDAERELAALTV